MALRQQRWADPAGCPDPPSRIYCIARRTKDLGQVCVGRPTCRAIGDYEAFPGQLLLHEGNVLIPSNHRVVDPGEYPPIWIKAVALMLYPYINAFAYGQQLP